jgi:ribonuclease-3
MRTRNRDVQKLTDSLGYTFCDDCLLDQALTHRSARPVNNERLEFLGDALLGFFIAESLFNRHPDADEGLLTRARAALVNRDSLAGIARVIDLGGYLILGEGELKSGGWRRPSILANALEAVIGACYLDGGVDACRLVVESLFKDAMNAQASLEAQKDAKTRLQEYLQSRRRELPRYETIAVEGAPHQRTFYVSCSVPGWPEPVKASGNSRRRAEQAAAAAALEVIEQS